MPSRTRIYVFEEVQRFRQGWLWALILTTSLLTAGAFAWGLYQQLFLGKPWGASPMSDAGLLWTALAIFAVSAGLPLFFYAMRMTTRLADERLEIHYFPLRRKIVPLSHIISAEARTYSPIGDYGGWGIKYGGREKGWVYNVSGNRGVFLVLRDGGRLMVGSQEAERLAAALAAALGR